MYVHQIHLQKRETFAASIGPTLTTTSIPSMSKTAPTAPTKVQFATFDVTNQVFYENQVAVALVNLKPVVPGHVLVIPKTGYRRLQDVPPNELGLLFAAVQAIGRVVEHAYAGDSLSIAIQDGANAGQTVEHMHVHVLPRRARDIVPNDLIYDHLEQFGLALHSLQEKQMDSERRPREPEQMHAEAAWLRKQCVTVFAHHSNAT